MEWVWDNTDDSSIIAVTQKANAPSLRLLRRLGFEEEAIFEEYGASQVRLRLTRPVGTATRDS